MACRFFRFGLHPPKHSRRMLGKYRRCRSVHRTGAGSHRPVVERLVRAGPVQPGTGNHDLHQELRFGRFNFGDHLPLKLAGVTVQLHQVVHINKSAGGTAMGVEINLRLGADHRDARIRGGMFPDIPADFHRFHKWILPINGSGKPLPAHIETRRALIRENKTRASQDEQRRRGQTHRRQPRPGQRLRRRPHRDGDQQADHGKHHDEIMSAEIKSRGEGQQGKTRAAS